MVDNPTLIDVYMKMGSLDAKQEAMGGDIAEIKTFIMTTIPKHHDRLSSLEVTDKVAKRAATWGGTALGGFLIWLFRGGGAG